MNCALESGRDEAPIRENSSQFVRFEPRFRYRVGPMADVDVEIVKCRIEVPFGSDRCNRSGGRRFPFYVAMQHYNAAGDLTPPIEMSISSDRTINHQNCLAQARRQAHGEA